MRVLITGASGFLGTEIIRQLIPTKSALFTMSRKRGRLLEAYEKDGLVKVLEGDLSQAAIHSAFQKALPEVIFHLAGRRSSGDSKELHEVNVEGTRRVLEAARLMVPSPKIIFAGSSAEYGQGVRNLALKENTELNPINPYGRSKQEAELLAHEYFTRNKIPLCSIRLFNLIGPGQSKEFFTSSLAYQISVREREEGGHVKLGDLSSVRDFIDVRDAARGFILTAQKGVAGETYNLCSGQATPISWVAEYMLKNARIPLTLDASSGTSGNAIDYQVGDPSKAKRELGWEPSITLKQSLDDILEYWRQNID